MLDLLLTRADKGGNPQAVLENQKKDSNLLKLLKNL